MAQAKRKTTKKVQKEVKAEFDLHLDALKPEDKKLTDGQIEELNKLKSTSARMRWMDANGFTVGNIARMLGKRYQHARNVLITPLKRVKK